jgi:hypothetical protein
VYAKIFSQIYDGTLCTNGPWQALVTFQQLLVLADQDGNVDMTAGAIARRTTIPLEIITLGIAELMKPDPESRTPTEEGKRIVPLMAERAWGWRIVNYKHYRALKREEDRRDYHREYWRNNRSSTQRDSTQTQHTQPSQPIAEAEAEAKTKAIPGEPPRPPKHPSTGVSSGPLRKKREGTPAPSAEVWVSYAKAYADRYGASPVRNASVNAQLAQFVGRIGADEAPQVAAFYLTHQNSLYVAAMHPTNLLLRDAEKLRTEWATNRQVTRAQATLTDRTQTNLNAFAPLIAEARMRERENAKS